MKESKICVIGLGYDGLPLARLFSTKVIDIYKALKEYNLNITVYDTSFSA